MRVESPSVDAVTPRKQNAIIDEAFFKEGTLQGRMMVTQGPAGGPTELEPLPLVNETDEYASR